MSRSLQELKDQCLQLGITVTPSGNRESKEDYEKALAEYFWNQEFPGKPMPPQHKPMLAFNMKDLVFGKMNKNDPNPVEMMMDNSKWIAQEKMQGARCIIHIGRPSHEYDTPNFLHSRRVSDQTYRMNDNSGNFRHITMQKFPPQWEGAVFDGEGLSSTPTINTGDTITQNIEKATIALINSDPDKSMQIQQEQGYLNLFLFDCLFGRGGKDMRDKPYTERQKEVDAFVADCQAAGIEHVKTLPTFNTGKQDFYESVVARQGEGIMLKDGNAPYEHKRSRAVYKMKKFIEVDGWVSGWVPSDPDASWKDLIGALEFSCYTETGAEHVVAACANLTLEARKEMTIKGSNGPELNPKYLGKIAEIRGMEWSSRNFRLTNARIERWREGSDGKSQEECVINLAAIKEEIRLSSGGGEV